jgi:hypothetical protein
MHCGHLSTSRRGSRRIRTPSGESATPLVYARRRLWSELLLRVGINVKTVHRPDSRLSTDTGCKPGRVKSVLDRVDESSYIPHPAIKLKSVMMIKEGAQRSKRLFEQHS